MRKVEVLTLCDAHMAWESTEFTEDVETLTIGGNTLDLCGQHRSAMAATHALWAEWSAPVGEDDLTGRGGRRAKSRRDKQTPPVAPPAAPESGDPACPLCSAHLVSVGALQGHLRNRHRTTVEAVYGLVCPLCAHESPTGRGLGIHARSEHSLPGGVVALFVEAEAAGDPHGVIASRAQSMAAQSPD